jgi:hypothetical protein
MNMPTIPTDYSKRNTSESVDLANWIMRVFISAGALVLFYGSLIWAAS